MSLASVDLPAPVGPTSAMRAPTGMVRSTSASTGVPADVGEATPVDLDVAPLGQVDGARALGDVDRRVEQLEQLAQRGAGRLHDVEQLGELLDRLEQVGEREDEEGDRADRERAVVHPPAADADRDGGGEQPGQLDDRQVPGRDLHGAHVGVEQAPVAELEAGRLDVLAPERLDDADAGDALLQLRQRVADAVAHVEVGRVGLALEADAGQHHERARRRGTAAAASTTRARAR